MFLSQVGADGVTRTTSTFILIVSFRHAPLTRRLVVDLDVRRRLRLTRVRLSCSKEVRTQNDKEIEAEVL